MKILLISEFFPSKDKIFLGGVQARTFYIAKYLSKKNDIVVISNNQTGYASTEKIGDVTVLRSGPYFENSFASSNSIFKRLIFIFTAVAEGYKQDFDLVEGSNFISHFAAFLIGFLKKKPKVAWYPDVLIGSWIKSFGLLSGLMGEISERIILRLPWDKFIAISNSTANKLKKRGIPAKKIRVIGCGVYFEEFKSYSKITKKEPIICTVSRLVSYKRVDDLISAFSIVKTKIINSKLYIIGDGPEYKNLKKRILNLKLENDVTFFSNLPRDKFIKTLSKASVFVLTSAIEGFGIVILEAAALKIPYIIMDLPVTREVTKNGEGGLFFNLGNISQLEKNIGRIVLNKKLYEKLSNQAFLLSRKYQWQNIADATFKVYEQASSRS